MRSRVEGTYATGVGVVSTLLAAYMHIRDSRLKVGRNEFMDRQENFVAILNPACLAQAAIGPFRP